MEPKYHLQKHTHRGMWVEIPFSHRVFVDSGTLVIYDENDEVLAAYAPGEWVECISDKLLKEMMSDDEW